MKISLGKSALVFSVVCLALFGSVKLRATTSALTGSCAAMMSLKPLHQVEYGTWEIEIVNGVSSSSTGAVDAMLLINFDQSKVYLNVTKATVTTSMDQTAWWYRTRVSYATETLSPIALNMSEGPLPGSYVLSPPNNEIPDLILMPVNSGNTFLIQAKDSKATGLCQKI
jgi:hypothetical protein